MRFRQDLCLLFQDRHYVSLCASTSVNLMSAAILYNIRKNDSTRIEIMVLNDEKQSLKSNLFQWIAFPKSLPSCISTDLVSMPQLLYTRIIIHNQWRRRPTRRCRCCSADYTRLKSSKQQARFLLKDAQIGVYFDRIFLPDIQLIYPDNVVDYCDRWPGLLCTHHSSVDWNQDFCFPFLRSCWSHLLRRWRKSQRYCQTCFMLRRCVFIYILTIQKLRI